MTFEITLLFTLIGISLVLFAFERLPADVIALGLLVVLVITGLLPAEEAFTGFSNSAIIIILALLIITTALLRTGVVAIFGREIIRRTGDKPHRLLAVVLITASLLGAFISNTASTAFFIPVVFSIARKTQISPSKLLLPLAFASILSSSVTLISTSTNIVVSGMMTRYDMPPMGMFELAPVGIPILIAGLLYMYFLGPRLIPDRAPSGDPAKDLQDQKYLAEVVVQPESSSAGKPIKESPIKKDLGLDVVQVVRDSEPQEPHEDMPLKEDDVILVEGKKDDILDIKSTSGIDIEVDAKGKKPDESSDETRVAEGLVLFGSPLIGRSLQSIRFQDRYGVQVLGINRRGESIREKVSQVRLRVGDVLLIQGDPEDITRLDSDRAIRIVGNLELRPPNLRQAPIAILAFVGALALGTFNIIPLSIALILAVLVIFVTRILTTNEAYREVEWRAIILIGSMLSVGAALEATGAAEWLAVQIVTLFRDANPVWLLTVFFALTVLLTQPMSNQAAAVVILPIAMQTASQLDLNPRTFAMMIAVAASVSYLTPLEPSCLMVYGPGRYRFVDFLKVGALLTIIIYMIAILLVPIVWPL